MEIEALTGGAAVVREGAARGRARWLRRATERERMGISIAGARSSSMRSMRSLTVTGGAVSHTALLPNNQMPVAFGT